MDKKKEYITKLLNVINSLHTSVSEAENEETLSFSFFKDSFSKGQEIMKLIHDLEMFHVEDMKHQMERLILFLSEKEKTDQEEVKVDLDEPQADIISETIEEDIIEKEINEEIEEVILTPPPPSQVSPKISKGFVLPTYTNPNKNRLKEDPKEKSEKISNTEPIAPTKSISEAVLNNVAMPSINDVVKAPQAKIDVKRNLSLNDRFYFQRELFNNDREAMNSMMIKLNAFNTFEEMEEYLRENTSWSFEDEDVKSFLEIVSKGII